MTFTDLRLDWLPQRGARLSKLAILFFSSGLLAVAAVADWLVGHISLGILHILPMMVAALDLEPLELAALALFGAFLRSRFDYPRLEYRTRITLRIRILVLFHRRLICRSVGFKP